VHLTAGVRGLGGGRGFPRIQLQLI